MNLILEPAAAHDPLYRRVMLPFLALLRMGATPRRLAWSIALGIVIGINPLIGSTSLLCLGLAALFRLNLAASQLANHLRYPLQIALVIPFLRVGASVFRTGPFPLAPKALFAAARARPIELMHELWMWEWHALVLWAAMAAIVLPALALALTPLLGRLGVRVQRHQYPIIESGGSSDAAI
jgi:uncharacterized protein (DUF2062 family)